MKPKAESITLTIILAVTYISLVYLVRYLTA